MLHLLNKEDWCQAKSQGAADTQALSECYGENKGAKVAAIAAARMEESVEAAVTAGKGVHLLSTVFSFCPKKRPGDQGLQGWTVRSWPFSLHQMFTASACAWSWPQTKQPANSWSLYQQHTPASAGVTLSELLLSTVTSFSLDNSDVSLHHGWGNFSSSYFCFSYIETWRSFYRI